VLVFISDLQNRRISGSSSYACEIFSETRVITGYNTDVEHDGVVYHVQTEDKGIGAPVILSLVYVGGAILASKRSPYDDLVTSGFDERMLVERLQRQHRLICAAIHAGRIEDLKSLSHRDPRAQDVTPPEPIVAPPEQTSALPPMLAVEDEQPEAVPEVAEPASPAPSLLADLSLEEFPVAESPAPESELQVALLEERELRGGEFVTLRVRVSRGTALERAPVPNARVIVKTLGSSFRPASTLTMTDRDGVAMVFATLPVFNTGRAAILVRAEVDGEVAELRRIILPT
jgi:hypothetical protein